jgi:hypothetical protein
MKKLLIVLACLALVVAMVAFDVVLLAVLTILGVLFIARPRAVSERLRRGSTWSANWGCFTLLTSPVVVVLVGAGWLWVCWWPFPGRY